MQHDSRIYIAGHRGLVGSAVHSELKERGYRNLLVRSHAQLDLRDSAAVRRFFHEEQPEYVILAAARVGGILANETYPADFIRDNLEIQNNVIEASRLAGVARLLFLGSSCIYPRLCPQPIREEYLLTGALEPTNRPYALAKIAGIEMCWSYNRQYGTKYLAAMPTNLYGPNDNFDLNNSHVLPALLRKVSEANLRGDRELAEQVCAIVGYRGMLRYDTAKPDGTPRKLLDVSRINALGWTARTSLEEGIRRTYASIRPKLECPV